MIDKGKKYLTSPPSETEELRLPINARPLLPSDYSCGSTQVDNHWAIKRRINPKVSALEFNLMIQNILKSVLFVKVQKFSDFEVTQRHVAIKLVGLSENFTCRTDTAPFL